MSAAVIALALNAPPQALGPDSAPARGIGPAAAPSQVTRTLTDANGRFVLHSLPAGEYSLSANRSGYLPSAFGQTQPSGGVVRRITLTDGQRLTNVSVKIWKYATIAGRLLDEAGEPAVAASVRIFRSTGSGPSRRYASAGLTSTDDRGVFRFSSLAPGDYLVMMPVLVVAAPASVIEAYFDANGGAAAMNQVRADVQATGGTVLSTGTKLGDQFVGGRGVLSPIVVSDNGKVSAYPTTFFPGVRAIESATIISVGAGQARANVDFAARPVPTVTVAGKVIAPGGSAANLTVKLVAASLESISGSTSSSANEIAWAITKSDGTFTAVGVPSGEYMATVIKLPVPAGRGSAAGTEPAASVLWGRAPVTVAEKDVDGVAIHLAQGATVSGRVEFEPGISEPPVISQLQRPQPQVTLTPLDPSLMARQTPTIISSDGSFKTQGFVPGFYDLTVSMTAPGWVLKSVNVGGRNLLEEPLDLAGPDITGVVATFTDKAGEISGTIVTNAAEQDALVVLLPVDYQAAIQKGNLQRRARVVGAAIGRGTYRVTGVLPGDYLVVALPRAGGTPDYEDAQAVATVARQATRVTIGEREKRTLTLTMAGGRRP